MFCSVGVDADGWLTGEVVELDGFIVGCATVSVVTGVALDCSHEAIATAPAPATKDSKNCLRDRRFIHEILSM